MAINQVSTANTFQEWVNATSALIGLANNLTDGSNTSPFIANSIVDISGVNSSLNVRNLANINTLRANTANISNISLQHGSIVGNGTITMKDANIWSNIVSVNTTGDLRVGGDAFIYGNLTISGNVTLDSVGFDDLEVNGSANIASSVTIGQDLTVSGVTLLAGNLTVGNLAVTGAFTGAANTAIYAAIAERDAIALAYSIALG